MKGNMRLLAVLLAALTVLTACQPTPETEPVANKGDRVLEEKISAAVPEQKQENAEEQGETEAESPAPVYQYTFPEKWEEVYDAGNDLILTFNAEITQKADGIYPVYRTQKGSVDREMVQKAAETLLAPPVSVHESGMTKDDWKKSMEQYIQDMEEHQARLRLPPEERGDGDDTVITQEQIDAELKWYSEQMAAAPDSLEETEVTDFSGIHIGGRQIYRLSDGDTAYISAGDTYWSIERSVAESGWVIASYDRWEYEDEGMVWIDASIEQEAALGQGQEMLDTLGLEGFALVDVYEGNYCGDDGWKHPMSGGYIMTYKRDFGGYPLLTSVGPAYYFEYGEGEDYAVNTYIGEEYIQIYADEKGVQYASYSNIKEVLKEENPSVELLPFEIIQERIRKGLTYGLTGKYEAVEIYKIVLTVNTQRVANSDEYYEVPCWIVFYDDMDYSNYDAEETQRIQNRVRAPHFCQHQALYINAVDGTVFHINYGN